MAERRSVPYLCGSAGEQIEEPRETELRVSLMPLGSSRWEQHSTSRTRYVDSRSGKGIDPYRSKRHIIEGSLGLTKTESVSPIARRRKTIALPVYIATLTVTR